MFILISQFSCSCSLLSMNVSGLMERKHVWLDEHSTLVSYLLMSTLDKSQPAKYVTKWHDCTLRLVLMEVHSSDEAYENLGFDSRVKNVI